MKYPNCLKWTLVTKSFKMGIALVLINYLLVISLDYLDNSYNKGSADTQSLGQRLPSSVQHREAEVDGSAKDRDVSVESRQSDQGKMVAGDLNDNVDTTFRFANSFSDHMVLQQAPESAILWGYAKMVGKVVTIVKNGKVVAKTTTFKNPHAGSSMVKWKVKIPPESQHGPFNITAKSGNDNATLHDVMFGDVWICSGQSNMYFSMGQANNSAAEIEDSLNYPTIRMLFSKTVLADTPSDDVIINYPWIKPTKGFIEGFSALCFMFGRELQKTYNYPIGLIESSWGGGTPIDAWSSPDALAQCQSNDTNRTSSNFDTWLWNSMIHPYLATTIKGAIWYQGEANARNPSLYACSFPAIIDDWRKKFHAQSMGQTSENFPFGFVQLAPWRNGIKAREEFQGMRWAQTAGKGFVPNTLMQNTFMAVAIDLSDFKSPFKLFHPRNKQDIALRLSLSARAVAYGDDSVVFQGPFPSSYVLRPAENRLQITFDGGQADLQVNNKDGFEICCSTKICRGRDTHWVWSTIMSTMTSSIELDTSVCTSANQHPTGVSDLPKDEYNAVYKTDDSLIQETVEISAVKRNQLNISVACAPGPVILRDLVTGAQATHIGCQLLPPLPPTEALQEWVGWREALSADLTPTQTNANCLQCSSLAKWKVKIPPESQHGPFSITAESAEGNAMVHDVMFGDVWICSGQSNMQFSMREANNSAAEIEDSLNYPTIRMVYSKLVTADTPSDDVIINHPWIKPTKGFIEGFSALCFMFGRELQKKYNYPIGLIESNWGGTRIEAWSSPDALAQCSSHGKKRANQNAESALWNSMINPYLATTIKGAIWYQGESNAGNPSLYACSFPAMIADWRKKFHAESMQQTSENFPFGFVQLAPWRSDTHIIQGFPGLRWAQTENTGFVPNPLMQNTFMAVAIDLPDFHSPSGSIHPRYKQDIALRLSLSARAVAYGDDSVVFQGPFPSSYVLRPADNRLQITFDGGQADLQVNNNDGFEICCTTTACQGNDAHWVKSTIMSTMTSSIELDTSVCTSANQHPAGVRYLWRESPCPLKQCALYRKTNNLPVPPFIQTGTFNTTVGVAVG